MYKKTIRIILTFTLFFCFMQINMTTYAANSDTYFTVDNVKYKKLSNSTVAVWDASSVEGDYSIPSKVNYNDSNYSVTQIGYKAFYGNEKLTGVVMPDSITKIQDGKDEDWIYYGAFEKCTNLKSVTFSKNLTYIGKFAFSGDEVLENVTIPNKVKNIMDEAFNDCKGITKLTLPTATTYVGQCAFYGTSLVTFTIPKTCEDFHFLTLDGIPTLTDICVEDGHSSYTSLNGIMYSSDMSTLECYPQGKKNTQYKLPKSVKILNMGVLAGNKYIKELVMNSVIDERGLGPAVIQDTNISTIKVSADNPYMKSVDGVLFSKNGDTLLLYPPAKKDEMYFVPSGTKHIGNGLAYTFEACQYLEELYVPASVETMTGTMWRSKKLKQVVFASEGNLTSIDSAMFQDCTALQSICFPKSIKYLSKEYYGNEFLDCYSLETLCGWRSRYL